MLVHLSIRDLAIIDQLDLPLEPGLVALTGETGAGKSILMGALELLRGGRAKAELVRKGQDRASVSAQVELRDPWRQDVRAFLDEHGLPPCDEDALVLRRVLSRAGRHKQFINGGLATVAQLKELVSRVLVITGQSDEQGLRAAAEQRAIVDNFGGHDSLVRAVREKVSAWRALRDEREALRAAAEDKLAQMDWLKFQVDEIEKLAPEPGELDKLREERERLKNVEGIRAAVAESRAALEDEQGDALGLVQRAAMVLAKVRDAELSQLSTQLDEAATLIDDVSRQLARATDDLQADPVRLLEVDDRVDALNRVLRKHGGTVETLIKARDEMAQELDAIEHSDERLAALDDELRQLAEDAQAACEALTKKRKTAGKKLSRVIEGELKDLGMKQAKVSCQLSALPPRTGDLSIGRGDKKRGVLTDGADQVELWLQANPGEEGGPLGRAASGGELSRVHLALKRALLSKDPVPISVFDEVDAGVGGAVAEAIGEKLEAIANEGRQVLSVTHLPQIAARASVHLKVEKRVQGGRTSTTVERLEGAARRDEIARMLGGKTITKKTREHAAEMIEQVRARA